MENLNRRFGEPYNWIERLCPAVQNIALYGNPPKSKKKYKETIADLTSFIRDKKMHYPDWSDGIKIAFGPDEISYINYFTSRFPALVPSLYAYYQDDVEAKNDGMLMSYYAS